MCILCTLHRPLQVGIVLICAQFAIWVVSAGVFTCTWGKYGLYVEQYTRWGLCFLAGGVITLYIVMMGILLGSHPQHDWADLVILNVKDLLVTNYDLLATQTPKLTRFPPVMEMPLFYADIGELNNHSEASESDSNLGE
jgi:hypothetical protein